MYVRFIKILYYNEIQTINASYILWNIEGTGYDKRNTIFHGNYNIVCLKTVHNIIFFLKWNILTNVNSEKSSKCDPN